MNAGYDSIAKVILMKKTDFNGIEGFKTKMIEKIYGGIQEKVKNANIVDIMVASNMFGRGLGRKKIEPIMEKYPNILTSNEKHEEKVEMLKTVTNIGKENAKSFASNINIFMNFLKEAKLEYKMNEKVEKKEEIKESDHILSNKNVVMTKVRDKEIIEKLNEVGGKLVDSINKNTFVLIVKNKEDESNKTKKAKELNIPIMEVDEFKKKYM